MDSRLAEHVDEAGRDHLPWASMVLLRGSTDKLPMAAIRPMRMPMSPEYQGEPVPSMMWPLVMTMSKDCGGDGSDHKAAHIEMPSAINAVNSLSSFISIRKLDSANCLFSLVTTAISARAVC